MAKQTATLLKLRGKPLVALSDVNAERGLKEIMKQSTPGLPCEIEVKVVPGGVDVLYVWRRAPPPEWPERVAADLRRSYEHAGMDVQVGMEHPIEVERDPNSVYELDFTVMLQRAQDDRAKPFWNAWIKGREEAAVSSMLPNDAIAGAVHGRIMPRIMEHGIEDIVQADLSGSGAHYGIGVLAPMLPEPIIVPAPTGHARESRLSDDESVEAPPECIDVREHIEIDMVTGGDSEDSEAMGWVHTHGMEQFDLPNLEIRGVPLFLTPDAANMLNHVAQYLVDGEKPVKLGETMQLGPQTIFQFVQLAPVAGAENHFEYPMWALSDAPLRGVCGAPDCGDPDCEDHDEQAVT